MVSRGRLFAAALCGVLSWSMLSFATEPNAADRETARELMKDARAARDRGDLKAALKSFEAADALMHVPTTGLEVARTRVQLGLLIEARDLALQIARSPVKPDDPPPFAEARKEAQKLSDDLEGRIPSIRIVVKDEGAVVSIDDAPLPAALIGLPRKINPGKHKVRVKIGDAERELVAEVFERELRDVPVDMNAPQGPAQPQPPPPTDQPSGARGKTLPLVLTIGGFGLAGVGAIVGSITGIMSISATDTIKRDCGGVRCPASRQGEIDSANTLATVSTITFVAAGVGAAVGVTGLVMLLTKPAQQTTGAHVRPWIGAGIVGVEGTF
jgi:hypothetical protein